MYKIFTIEVGNTNERGDYDKAEVALNDLEKKGWSIVSTLWDADGMQSGQGAGPVVFLHKK